MDKKAPLRFFHLLRRVEIERRRYVIQVSVWFGLLWWVGIAAFWACWYIFGFSLGIAGIVIGNVLAFVCVLGFDNIRLVRIAWSSGTTGWIFAVKNIFDFAKEDSEVIAFPNGQAALLRNGEDPLHELFLVLPGQSSLRIRPDIFMQLIVGRRATFLSCHKPKGLQKLKETFEELTESEQREFEAELSTARFLDHGFRGTGETFDCWRPVSLARFGVTLGVPEFGRTTTGEPQEISPASTNI